MRPTGDRPLFRSCVGGRFSGWGGSQNPVLDLIGLMAREGVMQALFKRLWRDDSGQDTTEHVLAVLLVALAVTAGMLLVPAQIDKAFNKAGRVLLHWI